MSNEFDHYYLQAKSIPFRDDEKQALHSSTPCELDERCCCYRREGKGIRKLIKILAIFGVMFIGYKALVQCVRIRYKTGRHELSEKAIISSMEDLLHPDIVIDHCTDWSSDDVKKSKRDDDDDHGQTPADFLYKPLSSWASFELPLSADSLFLFSRGATAGLFKLVQSPDLDPSEGVAKVVVVAKYRHHSALKRVKVCSVTRGGTDKGVVIVAPKLSKHVRVGFEVTVYLPKAVEEGPTLRVKRFETDLPLFAHVVGNIGSGIEFDAISLKTANLPISAESLSATKTFITTSNAAIVGNFSASESLEMITANGRISGNIGLSNDGERGVTDLVIKTSHAPIKLSLSTVSSTSSGGKFQINAKTALAPLFLNFTSADRFSTLLLSAHTSFAPASVRLPSSYEGRFSISTHLAKPKVIVDNEYDDRKVEYTVGDGGEVKGSVWWESDGEEGKDRGNVSVTTSLAPVVLRL